MSSYRRRLAAIANKLICGVDLSKQPDNELWYITTDGQKVDSSERNLIGGFGHQVGLQVVSHTYENGIGKVRYNADVVMFGEGTFRFVKNCLLISMPRKVIFIGTFSFDLDNYSVGYLVLLHVGEVEYNTQFKPCIRNALYVQPNCAQYYKKYYPNINIIEKKI
ncbi:hypothetical protein [Prevotella disiens]|uniref:hypothetical protein n=1 Tax=Prevotella disiens TaxID=28130 RepID=UPI00242F7F44|nr:hypothetical protein [Prevotella disiens]